MKRKPKSGRKESRPPMFYDRTMQHYRKVQAMTMKAKPAAGIPPAVERRWAEIREQRERFNQAVAAERGTFDAWQAARQELLAAGLALIQAKGG